MGKQTIAVIGNGPAGIRAAEGLDNHDILWIAPTAKPSPGSCGGVLTAPAISHLKQHGLYDSLLGEAGRQLDTLVISSGGQVLMSESLDGDEMVSFNRNRFDQRLYSLLKTDLPTIRNGYVREIKNETNYVRLQLNNGTCFTVNGVIDASGHRRLTDQNNGPSSHNLIGVEWHIERRLTQPGQLHLVLGDGFYAGLTTTGLDQTTISAVFSGRTYQANSNRTNWDNIRRQTPDSVSLPGQPPNEPKTKAGFWNEAWGRPLTETYVRVGDALGFTMPLSGEGIAMAMKEGTTAGRYLSHEIRRPDPFPLSRNDQNQLFERLVLPFRLQLPRWKRIHWLGMHGPVVRRIHRTFPFLTDWLYTVHKPHPGHW